MIYPPLYGLNMIKIEKDGKKFFQFFDRDRIRSSCRGTKFVEVDCQAFLTTIHEKLEEVNVSSQ